jgi:hypothetical protein
VKTTRWFLALLLSACTTGLQLPQSTDDKGLVPCASSSECPSDLPTCELDAKVCVGCIAGSCNAGFLCDEAKHLCEKAPPIAPCTRNADCPRPGYDAVDQQLCNVSAGDCMQCLTDADCAAPETCDTKTPNPPFVCAS